MNKQAREIADRQTKGYISRRGFTQWQLRNEPAIQQAVDRVWNDEYREALAFIELEAERNQQESK